MSDKVSKGDFIKMKSDDKAAFTYDQLSRLHDKFSQTRDQMKSDKNEILAAIAKSVSRLGDRVTVLENPVITKSQFLGNGKKWRKGKEIFAFLDFPSQMPPLRWKKDEKMKT